MSGWTNKGKYRMLGWVFRADTIPTNFYVALVTDAVEPVADINTFGELTEIVAGNGYVTGGYQLTPGPTDFDSLTEDDDKDRAILLIKDVVWNASGGIIPDSGDGARYAVLLDDNATIADREVLFYWDLGGAKVVQDGQSLKLEDCGMRIQEA